MEIFQLQIWENDMRVRNLSNLSKICFAYRRWRLAVLRVCVCVSDITDRDHISSLQWLNDNIFKIA